MAELKNIRIAISGIYDYAAEELPCLQLNIADAPVKKRVYKVYRPASVLSAACEKFKMLPLTHHHPSDPVDEQNFRKLAVGYTGENPFIDYLENKNEVGIRSTALLYDEEALDAYYRGEVQLSPGYVADFAWEQGTSPNGEPYDIVMRDIKSVNHLALLPAGRGGADAVVMDCQPTIFDLVKMQAQDGAPIGNDNASKDHEKKENKNQKTNNENRDEIKQILKNDLHKDILNGYTGIKAQLASEGLNKMMSGVAIKKSIDNGFTSEQHFEAVKNIIELYKNSKLVKVHDDKNHDKNVKIKRFVAQDKFKDGTEFDALITVKESYDHGHRIYSLELDEINKASQRWQVNDDGTLSTREPTTGSLTKNVNDNTEKSKSIFDIVKGN